jgi:hypothetical protein
MPARIQVSSNEELKDKVIDHGCDLLNRHELSTSQNRELQRFIDANSHLLNISDKEKEEREKKEKKQSRYANSLNRLSYGSSYSDYGTGRRSVGSNRINSPASEYGTGKRKEVSWSDGVRARSHSPSRSDGEGYDNANRNGNEYGRGKVGGGRDIDNDSMKNRQSSPAYSSLDRRDGDRNRRGRSTESPWKKPYVSPYSSNENVSSSGKPWHSYLREREISPAYSTLPRHPDDYNRYETKKYREYENEKFRWDDTAKFYGYGDRVGSGIQLTPKRWTGGEIIKDPTFIKKSIKPRRVYYSPIGDGVVEADGIEMKRGPKDMTPKIHVSHERYLERGSGGHGGVNIYEKRWDEDVDDGSGRGKDSNGYGGPPFDDGLGDKNLGYGKKPFGDDDDPYGSLGRRRGKPDSRGSSRGPFGDDDGFPRSGRSSALSIGTDGFPRQGWTKTFIVNPRELINQYALDTNTTIFDLEDHTPKTITTTKEIISNIDHEEDKSYY